MDMDSQLTILWIFCAVNILILVGGQTRERHVCLTGTMTDVQDWVDEQGMLTGNVDKRSALDLSKDPNPSLALMNKMHSLFRQPNFSIRYMSMARCSLSRVPAVFDSFEDSQGQNISQTVEYLSLYGNTFVEVSVPGLQYDVKLNARQATEVRSNIIQRGQLRAMWSASLQRVQFSKLRELDLRACSISSIDSFAFQNMPSLEALYLSENIIQTILPFAFSGLTRLKHLDLSNNFATDEEGRPIPLDLDDSDIFADLFSLKSLDFSNTVLGIRRSTFSRLGKSLERLSLCKTETFKLPSSFFSNTSLKVLDVFGNHGIFLNTYVLDGLQDTLEVLSVNEVGLTTFDHVHNFTKLQILLASNNEISNIRTKVAKTLPSLQVLALMRNRITNWFNNGLFSTMPNLKVLDLRNNTINLITHEMLQDFSNVSYVALSGNPTVCNCNSRDFIDIARRNEMTLPQTLVRSISETSNRRFNFHSGFYDMNQIIMNRVNISKECMKYDNCSTIMTHAPGNFLLLDYDPIKYTCLMVGEGAKIPFTEVSGCSDMKTHIDLNSKLNDGRVHLIALLAIPGVLLPALLGFLFRRNLRYFYVTIRNSAMLSMVNKNKIIDEDATFTYDVFVSYCNEDRTWVLDQLLSHLENDCSVSLCLHERDFQVGLSILENIVSCMDRSKCIMLVISQQFLLSQWCQFEMHLAQHRLLETRREDLILLLLEDIPRRLRPNTLHYLMLTKTYIVWPKNKEERHLFWKRLKKSVTTQQHKTERVTLT